MEHDPKPTRGKHKEGGGQSQRGLLAATNPRKAAFLRCIYGNPYRPANIGQSCQTPPIIALAQQAYDSRALPGFELNPEIMNQLVDALEKAGANPESILHVRGPGPHARGCWVVDELLGRPVNLAPQAKITQPDVEAKPIIESGNEFSPCQIIEEESGDYQLLFCEFESTSKRSSNSDTTVAVTDGTESWMLWFVGSSRS